MEYGAAVERYLASAVLSAASARVYRISLTGLAWPLVGRGTPVGRERRGAVPPTLPLALLDGGGAEERLRSAVRIRAGQVDRRTLGRELACLRSALTWWRAQGWLTVDPAAAQAPKPPPEPEREPEPEPTDHLSTRRPTDGPAGEPAADARTAARATAARAALALPAPLRELTLWHLVHESGAPVGRLLALDIEHLDLPGRGTRPNAGTPPVRWGPGTARLLPMLLLGRASGPVFVTDRRAPASTPPADRCPVTGRGRLSYRRAAELFAAATARLDPDGRGLPLLALRVSRRGRAPSR
ncbi:hypothetical protein [Phaeacidiphilus oryzae]|uniref:hypothetical protein n=1 Tax=Phaeacidiphilus oryzae TaxID=348818 RepID=UPI00068E7BAC|nr:hypothetical protein [Phaeacidiphilus oryzae]